MTPEVSPVENIQKTFSHESPTSNAIPKKTPKIKKRHMQTKPWKYSHETNKFE